REMSVERKDNRLILKETGAKEFWDYCLHHMEPDKVSFRLGKEQWKPFAELKNVFKVEWIDEVIKKELLTCHYQPIVTASEEIFAYELLSRFNNEDGSMIYPNEIFPA